MKASKISHRNEYRIKVDFPFDRQNVQKIRQIPDAKWSESKNSWHIPYSKPAFEMLRVIFPEVEYIKKIRRNLHLFLQLLINPICKQKQQQL